jgi:hypothetical protein
VVAAMNISIKGLARFASSKVLQVKQWYRNLAGRSQ